MSYRMISDGELRRFRKFMASGIPLDYWGPAGAYDSKPRRARDQDPEEGESKGRSYLDVILDLKDRMDPAGFRSLLMALLDETAQDAGEPPPFEGRPRPGGKIDGGAGELPAMDAKAAAGYRGRFPDAPKSAGYRPEVPRPFRRNAADGLAYGKRFPDAAKIGQG
jgi:hypothetical protein